MYIVTRLERLFDVEGAQEFAEVVDAEDCAIENTIDDSAWMVWNADGNEDDNNVVAIAFCGELYHPVCD